jgi:hypothetical protein
MPFIDFEQDVILRRLSAELDEVSQHYLDSGAVRRSRRPSRLLRGFRPTNPIAMVLLDAAKMYLAMATLPEKRLLLHQSLPDARPIVVHSRRALFRGRARDFPEETFRNRRMPRLRRQKYSPIRKRLDAMPVASELWVWVLGRKEVVTCFPERLGYAGGIFQNAQERMSNSETALDVAMTVLEEVVNTAFQWRAGLLLETYRSQLERLVYMHLNLMNLRSNFRQDQTRYMLEEFPIISRGNKVLDAAMELQTIAGAIYELKRLLDVIEQQSAALQMFKVNVFRMRASEGEERKMNGILNSVDINKMELETLVNQFRELETIVSDLLWLYAKLGGLQ